LECEGEGGKGVPRKLGKEEKEFSIGPFSGKECVPTEIPPQRERGEKERTTIQTGKEGGREKKVVISREIRRLEEKKEEKGENWMEHAELVLDLTARKSPAPLQKGKKKKGLRRLLFCVGGEKDLRLPFPREEEEKKAGKNAGSNRCVCGGGKSEDDDPRDGGGKRSNKKEKLKGRSLFPEGF